MSNATAIYARISEDELGTEAGVRRQLEDGRALAEARGWDVVAEFSDNDVSAYNGSARAGYQELMRRAEAGEFSRIVCYHTSRLWRSRTERAAGIGMLAAARVSLVAVKGPDLDLSSAYGRGMADLVGAFDTMESDVKSERVARAALQRALEGRASGGVAYGWRRVREVGADGKVTSWHDVVDEEQAAVVRDIVDRLLAGEPLRRIADDLNARGVPTPKAAGEWRNSTVRKLALRPNNIALRVHRGEVIGDAAWPAIVDRDKHDRVVALLSDPKRATTRSAARRHLLTYGIGECGTCGSVLRHVTMKRSRGREHHLYACEAQGCVGRAADKVDQLVTDFVVERLTRPDAADAFAPDAAAAIDASDRADAVRARLDQAADRYADGEIDDRQLARITERLRPQLVEAEQKAREARRSAAADVLDGIVGPEAAKTWEASDVHRRRAILEALGVRVRILPTRPGPGFEHRDVAIDIPTRLTGVS